MLLVTGDLSGGNESSVLTGTSSGLKNRGEIICLGVKRKIHKGGSSKHAMGRRKTHRSMKWKFQDNGCKMILGRDLGLEHVVGNSLTSLLEKFIYKSMNRNDIAR